MAEPTTHDTAPEPVPCPECGGTGVLSFVRHAHHPDCDGSCRRCPVAVEDQETCNLCHGSGEVILPEEEEEEADD